MLNNLLFNIICNVLNDNQVLRNIGFTASRFATFSFTFDVLKKLKHLDLSDNDIDYDSVNTINNFLTKLKNLRSLNLNKTSKSGQMKELFKNLHVLKNLEHLDLSDNNLNKDNIDDLIDALKKLSNIKSLSLSENNLNRSSIAKLSSIENIKIEGFGSDIDDDFSDNND